MKKKIKQGQTWYRVTKAFYMEQNKDIYIVEKQFVIFTDNYWAQTSSEGVGREGSKWCWSTPKKVFSDIYYTKAQMKKLIKLNPV